MIRGHGEPGNKAPSANQRGERMNYSANNLPIIIHIYVGVCASELVDGAAEAERGGRIYEHTLIGGS